jgi:FGGY-family pentulose kinase
MGGLSEKSAEQMGLPAGIAIGSGIIDAYAGWVGTIGAKTDSEEEAKHTATTSSSSDTTLAFTRLASVAGTSTCHLAMSPNPVFVQGVWGPYKGVLLPDFWMAEGGQSATGELIQEVLITHPAYEAAKAEASKANISIYEHLNNILVAETKAKKLPHIYFAAKHLFFYGDLHGNRSPVANPLMTGSIVGLTADKGPENLALRYYAAMEFIALQTEHIIQVMNDSGHQIQSVFLSGSQAKNEVLVELIATACKMPVYIPAFTEGAVALGAAFLGVKAASRDEKGNTEDLWSIMRRLTRPARKVSPLEQKDVRVLLDAKYKVYLDMVERQQEYRKTVDDALNSL